MAQQRRLAGWLPGVRLGIRARLFLLTLVTLSPLVTVLVLQDYGRLVAERERADGEVSRLAVLKAADVDQFLVGVEAQLIVLRAVVAADAGQRLANEAALLSTVREVPAYVDGIAAFSGAGQPLGEAWRDDLGPLVPASALADQVADTEARQRLVVGQPIPVPPQRAALVLVSRALTDRSGKALVLVLALRPDRMTPLTGARGLPRGATVSIVDVRGPLLARATTEAVAASGAGTGSAGGAVSAGALGQRPGSQVPLADDWVIGHAVLERAPWVVYVDAPAEVALVAAHANFVRDLVLGSLTLVIALVLAWLIAERISAPIRQLTADAVALGAGQLSRRTAVHSKDEIGILAGAFNESAAALEHLVGSLRTTQTELRSLNAHLEQRVRDRTAQLAALNSELEAFSFSVSHDLRAPLRRIDGFSMALREDYGERLDDDGRLMLERVQAGCEQMSTLIDDLLRLSRVSRAELDVQRVDLSALAEEIAEELRAAHPNHPVEVIVAGGLVAHADPSLLRVVVQNLLANAWKFTRGRPEPSIEVGADARDDGPAFFVRDNGVGFDHRRADRLFRAFQRLHDARSFEGTGIGLATVQRVIHRHGGRVWAEGAVGSGATFWFTVPESLEP